jgi:hypothetical protein
MHTSNRASLRRSKLPQKTSGVMAEKNKVKEVPGVGAEKSKVKEIPGVE